MSNPERIFPVTHSILSVWALIEEVLPAYDLGTALQCKLLNRGLNDTYEVVNAAGERYILRAYRRGWRTASEIGFELDVLNH